MKYKDIQIDLSLLLRPRNFWPEITDAEMYDIENGDNIYTKVIRNDAAKLSGISTAFWVHLNNNNENI